MGKTFANGSSWTADLRLVDAGRFSGGILFFFLCRFLPADVICQCQCIVSEACHCQLSGNASIVAYTLW